MTDREHHRRCKKCKHIRAIHFTRAIDTDPGCGYIGCFCNVYIPDHTLKYYLSRKLRLVPSIKD